MTTVGYSGTPLAKKLGIKEHTTILVLNSPKPYLEFFYEFPKDVQITTIDVANETIDFIHIFVTSEKDLKTFFMPAKPKLKKDGMLWLSWPKKTSEITTELDKFAIMKYGLNNGLVDTKVAAIDKDWSGHKFVYRKEDR